MSEPEVIVGDITTLSVAAIVNAANPALAPGGGVCGAFIARREKRWPRRVANWVRALSARPGSPAATT